VCCREPGTGYRDARTDDRSPRKVMGWTAGRGLDGWTGGTRSAIDTILFAFLLPSTPRRVVLQHQPHDAGAESKNQGHEAGP
jgi:hypothetical protein